MNSNGQICDKVRVNVRFSEVDALRMVWHGSYVKYLEDAREAFGKRYGLDYMTIFRNGYIAPMVDMNIRYLKPAALGDKLDVSIMWVDDPGAKIIFKYEIRNAETEDLLVRARSIQLFADHDGDLEVRCPDFYAEWKEKVKKGADA